MQVFLIVSHEPLVRQLANIILNRDMKVFTSRAKDDSASNKVIVPFGCVLLSIFYIELLHIVFDFDVYISEHLSFVN